MIQCLRCSTLLPEYELNAKKIYACSKCGKAYLMTPITRMDITPYYGDDEHDSWGAKIES